MLDHTPAPEPDTTLHDCPRVVLRSKKPAFGWPPDPKSAPTKHNAPLQLHVAVLHFAMFVPKT